MNRFEVTKKAGILGIVGNIFLLIIKSIIGFASHSQSMIADSANSAGDIFASLMTFIGNRIASEPGDNDHNFGHGKAEYMFSLFISVSMMALAAKLLYDSVFSLINHSQLIFSWMLVVVCIVTIIIKFALYIYTDNLSKKFNNILLDANKKDHRNDCLVTSFTLMSVLLSFVGVYWFDGVVGIGISIWIFITGLGIFIQSYNILMDISIDENTQNLIKDIVNKHSQVKKIDEISSTSVGYQHLIVLTICVDGTMSTFDSHSLADELESSISKLDNVYKTIIHVNPI